METSRDLVKGNPGETQVVLIQVSLNGNSILNIAGFSCRSEFGLYSLQIRLHVGSPVFYITEKQIFLLQDVWFSQASKQHMTYSR